MESKIYDSILIRENTGQWKPVFLHILCSDILVFSIDKIVDNVRKYETLKQHFSW